ncbi:hypothetical protein BLSMQ_2570 [Brevibacterium aurantiacum]|uniref:Uncharacterized protein n=1 Tax=Brevibacterium aurantiacum TaxID=273384 RepID=A0A1D7W5H5_BREAU|nr:hypothetical protein BLSMQ_2570 [Brevibacterium aurantiacum]
MEAGSLAEVRPKLGPCGQVASVHRRNEHESSGNPQESAHE